MLKAVLVDLDGTIVDTEYANASAYSDAFLESGIKVSIEGFIQDYHGMSWKMFMPMILSEETKHLTEIIVKRKRIIYQDKLGLTKLNRNIMDLVQSMSETKKLALVTTASKEAVSMLLEHHKIKSLFDFVVTGQDVINSKPSPEGYLLAAQHFGLDIKDCIILEDSEIGIKAAKASGATVLVVG